VRQLSDAYWRGLFDYSPMNTPILAFSTSNYDAMLEFLRDFGFSVVEDAHDRWVPFFERGRAARVRRGEFEFQLEESGSRDAVARFNLALTDSNLEEVARIKALGYECDHQVSMHGDFHSFRSPDGGIIVL